MKDADDDYRYFLMLALAGFNGYFAAFFIASVWRIIDTPLTLSWGVGLSAVALALGALIVMSSWHCASALCRDSFGKPPGISLAAWIEFTIKEGCPDYSPTREFVLVFIITVPLLLIQCALPESITRISCIVFSMVFFSSGLAFLFCGWLSEHEQRWLYVTLAVLRYTGGVAGIAAGRMAFANRRYDLRTGPFVALSEMWILAGLRLIEKALSALKAHVGKSRKAVEPLKEPTRKEQP